MPVITSRNHPLIKQLIKLENHHNTAKNGLTLLDGVHLVQIYHAVLGSPENLVVSQSYSENSGNKHFLNTLFKNITPRITIISDALFREISPVKRPQNSCTHFNTKIK